MLKPIWQSSFTLIIVQCCFPTNLLYCCIYHVCWIYSIPNKNANIQNSDTCTPPIHSYWRRGGALFLCIYRYVHNFGTEWGFLGAYNSWVDLGVVSGKESTFQPSFYVSQVPMWNTAKGYSINLTSNQKQSPKDSSTLQFFKCSQHYKMLMTEMIWKLHHALRDSVLWSTPWKEVLREKENITDVLKLSSRSLSE